MPTPIRIMLSIVVAVVALFVFFVIESRFENASMRWFSLALAVAMELAIWLFPEAKRGTE